MNLNQLPLVIIHQTSKLLEIAQSSYRKFHANQFPKRKKEKKNEIHRS